MKGIIKRVLNNVFRLASSATAATAKAPAVEKGEYATNTEETAIIENNTPGLLPVASITPGTIGYRVGITTPNVLEKMLITPETIERKMGAVAADT